mmetsp:Transcript_29048/g.40117  ORF Transcript_29048/g.40117 Transcript_29048/m.40117 type:complete len:123 (+) Transcript_29048:258-626(+)
MLEPDELKKLGDGRVEGRPDGGRGGVSFATPTARGDTLSLPLSGSLRARGVPAPDPALARPGCMLFGTTPSISVASQVTSPSLRWCLATLPLADRASPSSLCVVTTTSIADTFRCTVPATSA